MGMIARRKANARLHPKPAFAQNPVLSAVNPRYAYPGDEIPAALTSLREIHYNGFLLS